MDIETIKLLARYSSATTETMNGIIATLSDQEWKKPFGGYYPSVQSICNHLYITDFNWLKRFGNIREFAYTKLALFAPSYTLDSRAFDSIEQYLEMRKELDAIFIKLSEELLQLDFGKTLKWINFRGEDQARNFGGIILHMFNHQTHHRGMISLYLEFLGKPNDFSNLMFLV